MNGKVDVGRLVNEIGFWLSVVAVFLTVLYFAPFEGRDGIFVSPSISGALTHSFPPTSDLTAHWKMDDGSGSSISDSSVTNNIGNFVGNPVWTSGKVDGGLSFDGVDDFVEVAHSDAYLLSEGSVAFWFKTDDAAKDQGLFSKDSNGFDSGGHLTIYLQNSRVKTRIQSTSASFTVESGVVQSDTWYHVAFTFGSGGLKLYVDGGSPFTDASHTGGLLGNREPIAIGAKSWSSDNLVVTPTHSYTDGVIDDVRIYNRALTSAEVIAIVSPPPPPPPPPHLSPPVTSILCDGVACERDLYSDSVTITLNCNDDSGCASTNYCVHNCPSGLNCLAVICEPSVYDANFVPVISDPGTNSVLFFSVDIDGNVEETQIVVIEIVSDTIPPVLSSGDPVRIVVKGTTETNIDVDTVENATCKYSAMAGRAYDDSGMMLFDATGSTIHSALVGDLSDGNVIGYGLLRQIIYPYLDPAI